MDKRIPPNNKNPYEEGPPFPEEEDDEFPESEFELEETPHHVKKEDTSSHEVSLEKTDVASVPIRIDFELARLKVSLGELQKMEAGYKLPITVNPRIVNLVVGDKTIGRGEIVDIGEVACIKVLELYK